MDDIRIVTDFKKSSRSGNGGNTCVEVALAEKASK